MNLEEKANGVAKVLSELDKEISQFQGWSGLHCKAGCGKCCFKPDIEATPLEFLPFAFQVCKDGKADIWLDKFDSQPEEKVCLILNPNQLGVGLCSEYEYRGMICRLFGYSARTNKYEKKELLTCAIIKEEQSENFLSASEKINRDQKVPLTSDYYLKLHYIDPNMAIDFMPINKAIHRAIELASQHFTYTSQER